jgi:hypothetical protein
MARIYLALISAVLFLTCQEASAQICKPVAERTGEVGCWIIAHQPVGQLNKPGDLLALGCLLDPG